ncbi:ABC transporter ATP-binding protein [Candidatus Formimonas warabiya]|uniref:ABC transporter ATP-binding protein n=1 Tax=Formimonas warabiya TaxID=1761012 RepID=A0A3G1KY29_FORW1|nr:ABC transporter ATP-binding protein [Candidatus Formimonas warabiya]ATW27394.1 ABC transporter ATP-binding protein [Candidatus Formimonas warabiya]
MLLEIKELSKEYKRGERPFAAVDQINLSVAQGDFVTITGRSGSGKSTLLNMVAGLLTPTSGTISLKGRKLDTLNDKEMSAWRNFRLGYVPQGTSALAHLTVFDNVRLPFYLAKRQGDPCGRAVFLLEEVGLPHLAHLYPPQLSGGELRRVFIARALMNEPDLLMADEPTADLDQETTREMMALFCRINKNGTTVIIVSHERDTGKFGNRVLTMSAGKLRENLPADEK